MTPRPPAPCSLAPGLPLARRPAPRRLLAMIALAVLLIAAAVPAVSASVIYDEHLADYIDTSSRSTTSIDGGYQSGVPRYFIVKNIELHPNLYYLTFEFEGDIDPNLVEGRSEFTYVFNGKTRPGVVYKDVHKSILGNVLQSRLTIFLNEWDIGELTGLQAISLPFLTTPKSNELFTSSGEVYLSVGPTGIKGPVGDYKIASSINWYNHLLVEDSVGESYHIALTRTINSLPYTSTINTSLNGIVVTTNHDRGYTYEAWFPQDELDTIHVITPDNKIYTYPVESSSSAGSVTIYVQSSQTGALLANAHLSILAAAGDPPELIEVVNATLPGGVGTYTLQPTGPTNPNPRYYRAVATVPGYTQIIENHSFTLNGPHDVIIEMRPDTGGPLDPDRAYLEFYVRDIHANPISSASVQCDGRIKTTNSQGYAVFEVSKNATYPYVAKKSGYVTIEGTATVADGPRYVANVVLGPGSVPTYTPTLGPGETPGGPGATPTPDTRTNEQKGQAIIDLIADFAEPIAILAILATIFGLMKMMTPGRR